VLERQVFEEYKNKILRGMIDEVKEVTNFSCRKNLILFGEKINLLNTIILA